MYCENDCVPVGGAVELTVALKPGIAGQFDVKLYVDFKEGKSCSLRIAGKVECPSVSVSKVRVCASLLLVFLMLTCVS